MHYCLRRQAESFVLVTNVALRRLNGIGRNRNYGIAFNGRCVLVLFACLRVCWRVERTDGMSWNGLNGRQG